MRKSYGRPQLLLSDERDISAQHWLLPADKSDHMCQRNLAIKCLEIIKDNLPVFEKLHACICDPSLQRISLVFQRPRSVSAKLHAVPK